MIVRPKPVVLWAIPVSDLGGVARHVLDVGSNGLPGWDLRVLCPPGPLADLLIARGIDARSGAFGPSAGTAESIRTLRRQIDEVRPAIVHSHLAHADVIAAVVGAGRGGRLVSTEHGIAADDAVYHRSAVTSTVTSTVMAGVHRIRQRRLDGLIAVSQATLDTVRAKWHPPRSLRCAVIPNGIDRVGTGHVAAGIRRAPGLRIGAVARLAPEKRLDDLITAFASIVAEHPDAHLTIAGDGDLADQLRDRVVRDGLEDKVDFPGHVDTARIFEILDVVAMPSVFENCSYTLLEAASKGCGVVATAVGGNAEILPAHALVPLGDTRALAAAITQQGLDPDLRPVLDPTWPSVNDMCNRIVQFYDTLLG